MVTKEKYRLGKRNFICGPKDQSGLDGEVLEIENRC
jgi:hypothetical protein